MNATPVVVVWTMLAAIGVGAAASNLIGARRDLRDVREGPYRAVTRANAWAEFMRFLSQGLFLAVGMVAMFGPLVLPPIARIALQWSLVVGAGAFTVNSLLARYSRKKLNQIIEEGSK
jgi:hypothetical protein